jgi:hypothetical protein
MVTYKMPCLILWDDNDDAGWVKKDHGSFVKEGLNMKGFFSSIE